MAPRCVVLDFDGTFTDVAAEAVPFVAAFQAAVADVLGRDIRAGWEEAAIEIGRHPGRYGWVHEGHVVAPAAADPYIRSTAVAQQIFNSAGVLRSPELRAAVLQSIYHLSYECTVTAFRPSAREVIEAIVAAAIPVFIVTNARPDAVKRKLATLAPVGLERLKIIGDARKFAVGLPEAPDARFEAVPAERRLPGLERPVYPRRGRYFDALARIVDRTGALPAEVLVCGDIYELDLSLPIELGMGVHLVTGPATPAYELAALAALGPRASHAAELTALIPRLAR